MPKKPSKTRGRPLKGEVPRVRVSFTLPPELHSKLKSDAEANNLSASEILEQCLQQVSSENLDASKILSDYAKLKKDIATVVKEYPIKKLSLFGSTLHQTATPNSDIDLLVEFNESQVLSFFELAELEGKLAEIFGGKKIDLRTANELSQYFRDDVVAEAVVIYGR